MNEHDELLGNHDFVEINDIPFRRSIAEAMATSIAVANDVNPNSWSLDMQGPSWHVLFVGSHLVTVMGPNAGSFIALGSIDPEDELRIGKENIYDEYPFEAFYLRGVPAEEFTTMIEKYRERHVSAVKQLAAGVRTNTNRKGRHYQAVVDGLASELGISLPSPAYWSSSQQEQYRSSDQSPTGFWKQDVERSRGISSRDWLSGSFFSIDMLNNPDENLSSWPEDRREFVEKATQFERIGGGTAHRLWMFAKAMKTGDEIFVHDKVNRPLLIGEVQGDYQYVGGSANQRHRRRVSWLDVSGARIPETSDAYDAFSRSRWGLTVMDEGHFRAVQRFVRTDGAMLEEWDQTVLQQFASSIQVAHDRNPGSWSLYWNKDEITLTVGNSKVLASSPSLVHLLVGGLPESQVTELVSTEQLSNKGRAEKAATWVSAVPTELAPRVLEAVREDHLRILELLANSANTNPKSHDSWLLTALASRLGKTLPIPILTEGGTGEPEPKPPIDFARMIDESFIRNGLSYTPDQLATFYTALQTKGFVVLSGISGTGKSKIAQGFVGLLPLPDERVTDNAIDPESVISVTVKPYMRNYRRIVIPVKQEAVLPDIEKGKSITLQLSINGTTEKARLSRRQDTGSLYLYFRQVIGDHFKALDLGRPIYLRPMVTGDDEETLGLIEMFTDPAQLPTDVRLSEQELESRNSLFLAVRPDWRDSTSLLGYYNPLTETYEWTEFLRFLLRAVDDYRANKKDALAWFVILDEMNLAHVEYYFADLLSIIESGRDEEGWSREPIRLTYPDTLDDNALRKEIKLPPNLYIIGTVNMDETTHAFSPKVLDRAFTIELTDVDFRGYPPAPANGDRAISDEERRDLLRQFTRDGVFAQVSKDDVRAAVEAHPQMRNGLQNLNERLAQHQFHFGYRVFDEIAQFIHNADRNGMFDDWTEAFDHAVFMKVLPKFNGSYARLHDPLKATLEWANDPARTISVPLADDPDDTPAVAAPRLARVATRVQRMLETLEKDGFVSFG